MTGVRYLIAIRGRLDRRVEAVRRRGAPRRPGTGDSPLRPYSAISRSACSVFVGMPVDGPAALHVDDDQRQLDHDGEADRLGLQQHARAADVVVTASAPPNAAPSAAPTAAISSSAWNVRTPKFLCLASSCRMSEAGVIG